MHQSALARMEQQDDLLVSSLVAYLRGVGASLEILARFTGASPTKLRRKQSTSLDAAIARRRSVGSSGARDVVFSIKPEYSERIFDGAKTVELRRRFPINVIPGTIALIYTTTPVRALTGMAEIEGVVRQSPTAIWNDFADQTCVSRSQFRSYFAGVSTAVAIKLRGARRLRAPIELAELRERFSFEPPQSFLYAQPQLRQALENEWSVLPNRHERLHRT